MIIKNKWINKYLDLCTALCPGNKLSYHSVTKIYHVAILLASLIVFTA